MNKDILVFLAVIAIVGCTTSENKSISLASWKSEKIKTGIYTSKDVLIVNNKNIQWNYYINERVDSFWLLDTTIPRACSGSLKANENIDEMLDYFVESFTIKNDSIRVHFWKPVRREIKYKLEIFKNNTSYKFIDVEFNPVIIWKDYIDTKNKIEYTVKVHTIHPKHPSKISNAINLWYTENDSLKWFNLN